MKAPILYWLSVAYLVLLVAGMDYGLIATPPPVAFPYNAILDLIAILYTLATVALILRRKVTVPIFLAAFVTFALGEAWAIWKTGMGPGIRDPKWLAINAWPILIVVVIVFYSYRLTQRGFLR